MPYTLFFSYARNDWDSYLQDFFDTLVHEVALKLGLRQEEIAFLDTSSIEQGQPWNDDLAEALRTCQAFVAVCSPSYYRSEWCGKEWAAFQARLPEKREPGSPAFLIPVLWIPDASVPVPVGELRYTNPHLPERAGLRQLGKLDRSGFTRATDAIVDSVVLAARVEPGVAPQASPMAPSFAQVASAFLPALRSASEGADPPPPGPATPFSTHIAYLVGSQEALRTNAEREQLEAYGASMREWRPYFPADPRLAVVMALTTVAQVAHDERISYEGPLEYTGCLTEQIEEAEARNHIVLIVLDCWSTLLAEYRAFLQSYDRIRAYNTALVVVWNDDEETRARAAELDAELRLLLLRQRVPTLAKTPSEFRQGIVNALLQCKREIRRVARLLRPVEGRGPAALPGL